MRWSRRTCALCSLPTNNSARDLDPTPAISIYLSSGRLAANPTTSNDYPPSEVRRGLLTFCCGASKTDLLQVWVCTWGSDSSFGCFASTEVEREAKEEVPKREPIPTVARPCRSSLAYYRISPIKREIRRKTKSSKPSFQNLHLYLCQPQAPFGTDSSSGICIISLRALLSSAGINSCHGVNPAFDAAPCRIRGYVAGQSCPISPPPWGTRPTTEWQADPPWSLII